MLRRYVLGAVRGRTRKDREVSLARLRAIQRGESSEREGSGLCSVSSSASFPAERRRAPSCAAPAAPASAPARPPSRTPSGAQSPRHTQRDRVRRKGLRSGGWPRSAFKGLSGPVPRGDAESTIANQHLRAQRARRRHHNVGTSSSESSSSSPVGEALPGAGLVWPVVCTARQWYSAWESASRLSQRP